MKARGRFTRSSFRQGKACQVFFRPLLRCPEKIDGKLSSYLRTGYTSKTFRSSQVLSLKVLQIRILVAGPSLIHQLPRYFPTDPMLMTPQRQEGATTETASLNSTPVPIYFQHLTPKLDRYVNSDSTELSLAFLHPSRYLVHIHQRSIPRRAANHHLFHLIC